MSADLGRAILAHLASQCGPLVVVALAAGTMRFTTLARSAGGLSSKTLAHTLRGLERDGLVSRELFLTIPPRVEYSLTPLGQSLLDLFAQFTAWAAANATTIEAARRQFATRRAGR